MVGWGASTGEASSPLRSLLATYDTNKGFGAVNWGRYSNPKVDYLIEQALQQVDDENRQVMLQRATELAMSDLAIMPIHFQFTIWATRKGVTVCAAHRRIHAGLPVQGSGQKEDAAVPAIHARPLHPPGVRRMARGNARCAAPRWWTP